MHMAYDSSDFSAMIGRGPFPDATWRRGRRVASDVCRGMACDPRGGVGFVPVYRALHFQGREQSRHRPRFYLLVSAGFARETAGPVQRVPVTRSSRAHARLRLDTLWLRWGFPAGATGWGRAARWVDAHDSGDTTAPPFKGRPRGWLCGRAGAQSGRCLHLPWPPGAPHSAVTRVVQPEGTRRGSRMLVPCRCLPVIKDELSHVRNSNPHQRGVLSCKPPSSPF